jgi:hypothetical protein
VAVLRSRSLCAGSNDNWSCASRDASYSAGQRSFFLFGGNVFFEKLLVLVVTATTAAVASESCNECSETWLKPGWHPDSWGRGHLPRRAHRRQLRHRNVAACLLILLETPQDTIGTQWGPMGTIGEQRFHWEPLGTTVAADRCGPQCPPVVQFSRTSGNPSPLRSAPTPGGELRVRWGPLGTTGNH